MRGSIQTPQNAASRLKRPTRQSLEYAKLLLEVVLLMLALPLVLWHIRRNPGQAAERAWTRGG